MQTQKLYGLIGYPLSHSFSDKYFNEKFVKESIKNCEYKLFPLEHISKIKRLIELHENLFGLNVTIPFKETIISYLDDMDEIASSVGAVNCIKIERQGSSKPFLKGYNTDITGFQKSIKPFLQSNHERALIIGTGGASKAVEYVLKNIGIECFFVTRNKKGDKHLTYNELNENVFNAFKLIINTSPVGMFPNINDKVEIPYEFINHEHLLYDLIYNPNETQFLKTGKEKGAAVINGLSMLELQAEEAWKIWNQ